MAGQDERSPRERTGKLRSLAYPVTIRVRFELAAAGQRMKANTKEHANISQED